MASTLKTSPCSPIDIYNLLLLKDYILKQHPRGGSKMTRKSRCQIFSTLLNQLYIQNGRYRTHCRQGGGSPEDRTAADRTQHDTCRETRGRGRERNEYQTDANRAGEPELIHADRAITRTLLRCSLLSNTSHGELSRSHYLGAKWPSKGLDAPVTTITALPRDR